jgi:3-deoxy-7-phosphoheptulonate synthase
MLSSNNLVQVPSDRTGCAGCMCRDAEVAYIGRDIFRAFGLGMVNSKLMAQSTDDLRVREIKELISPSELLNELPCTDKASATTSAARQSIHRILHGDDDRLLVVIGPCSIHDPKAAIEYAGRLTAERKRFASDLEIVMRVYFEKPRTTVGWKGLINDPDLDGSFQINRGLRLARKLLLDINELGLPAGCEYLDPITPQYHSDLVSWGAVGARTTESQTHRELASGLSCPVGFKNGTDGNIKIAIDAVRAASQAHHFLGVTKEGRSAIVSTRGNDDCHIILRGGKVPNYEARDVNSACLEMQSAGLAPRLMIDASHANSKKDPANQIPVCVDIAAQISRGDTRIIGVMIESHLVRGRQDLQKGVPLTYGQSITDGCIGWEESPSLLVELAEAVQNRRVKSARADL